MAASIGMILSSRFGKLRLRDRMLAGLEGSSEEQALDVGCGRGLVLLGLAARGYRAVGVDKWSNEDLSDNSEHATLENAKAAHVADRVSVASGDARELPFDDDVFEVVTANYSLHNIPTAEGRRRALEEMLRVLKPGGRIIVGDFRSTGEYVDSLRDAGASDVSRSGPVLTVYPPARIVRATKPKP